MQDRFGIFAKRRFGFHRHVGSPSLLGLSLYSPYRSHRNCLHFQRGEKRLLGDFHFADLFHAFLTLFLLLQQFAFARNIAAITFGDDVFA